MDNLLGIKRQTDSSFITEHMMVKSIYMRELISELYIAAEASGEESWYKYVLNNIDDHDLPCSGFSEYETYGNFLLSRHPGSIEWRKRKYLRMGTFYYGMNPNKYDLASLIHLGNSYTSFETYIDQNRYRIAKNKIFSLIRSFYRRLTKPGREELNLAGKICGEKMPG